MLIEDFRRSMTTSPTQLMLPTESSIEVIHNNGICLNIHFISVCSRLGYQTFYFPNFRGQKNISEINRELSGYNGVIQSQCSNAIAHLVCSVYAPLCYSPSDFNTSPQPIYPCYQLCKYVKDDCESYYNGVDATWPQILDCNNSEVFKNDSESLIFCPTDMESLQVLDDDTELPTSTFDENYLESASKIKSDLITSGKCIFWFNIVLKSWWSLT